MSDTSSSLGGTSALITSPCATSSTSTVADAAVLWSVGSALHAITVLVSSIGVLHLSCHLSTPDHVRRPLSLFQMPCLYHHQSFRPSALLLHSGGNTWIWCDISLHFCSFADRIFFQFAWPFLPVNVSFMMLLTFEFYIIDIYFIPTVVCVFALLL